MARELHTPAPPRRSAWRRRAPGILTLLCLIMTSVWLWSEGAPAAAGTPKEEARKLFKEGNRLNARGDHRGALNRYIRARTLYPSYKIDLNIAATLYSMGRLTHAVVYYERFLERAGPQADRQAADTARAKLQELRARLASLTVSCSEEGATITVDGKLVGRTPLPRRVYVQPGLRRVLVERGRRVLLQQRLDLARGAHRDLVITGRGRLRRPLDGKPDVPPGKTLSPFKDEERGPPPPADASAARRRKRKTVLGWAFLGAGLATGAAAAALYGLGVSGGARAHEDYMAAREPGEIRARWGEVEEAQTKVVAGHVLAGVTAVAVGLAIHQFVSRPDPRPESPGVEAAVGPTAGAGGATLWIRGSF